MKSTKPFVIGIDPGVETGVAVWQAEIKRFIALETLDFWRTFTYLSTFPKDSTKVVVENPALNNFSYARHKQTGKDGLKIARNSGGNCREAELLIEGLKRDGYDVMEIKPTRRKWTAEQLKRYTGYEGRTNQHVRDAMALVHGL
jgi:hypothetical protein